MKASYLTNVVSCRCRLSRMYCSMQLYLYQINMIKQRGKEIKQRGKDSRKVQEQRPQLLSAAILVLKTEDLRSSHHHTQIQIISTSVATFFLLPEKAYHIVASTENRGERENISIMQMRRQLSRSVFKSAVIMANYLVLQNIG